MTVCPAPRVVNHLDARFVVAVWHEGTTRYARRIRFPAGKLYGLGSLDEAEVVTGAQVPAVIMALLTEHALNLIEVRSCANISGPVS